MQMNTLTNVIYFQICYREDRFRKTQTVMTLSVPVKAGTLQNIFIPSQRTLMDWRVLELIRNHDTMPHASVNKPLMSFTKRRRPYVKGEMDSKNVLW